MTGDELRRIRKRLGKTQAELAALLGTHANTVARWERGERGISGPVANLVRMIDAQQAISRPKRRVRRETK